MKRSVTHQVKNHRYKMSHDLMSSKGDCPPSDGRTSKLIPLRKNRESTMTKEEEPAIEVVDAFKIPMKSELVKHSGKSFVRTV